LGLFPYDSEVFLWGVLALLKGLGSMELSMEDGGHFLKSDASTNKGFLLKLIFGNSDQSFPPYPPAIKSLLLTYKSAFAEPTDLPPSRAHDYKIPLTSSTPFNVWAYRYLYFQKAEIEKLIQEMLLSGVIRPSQSPLSAPVLLVRKLDGSWHLYVDYRALNHKTIKDKFSIPIIDELLDKLHGAVVFPSWIYVSGITKFECIRLTFLRQRSGPTRDIMSSSSCPSALQMHQPLSKAI
jgi:hypothetical protein